MADAANELPPETVLWRRIPPWHFPKKPGQQRPNSPAFDDSDDGTPMSAVIARADRPPQEVIAGYEGYGLVSLRVQDLIAFGQRAVPEPLPEEPDHVHVIGLKTDITRRQMAKSAIWVIPPPQLRPRAIGQAPDAAEENPNTEA